METQPVQQKHVLLVGNSATQLADGYLSPYQNSKLMTQHSARMFGLLIKINNRIHHRPNFGMKCIKPPCTCFS